MYVHTFVHKKNPEQNEFFFMSYYSAETPKEGAISEKLSVHYQNNNSEIFAQNFAVVILVVNT